MTLCNVILYTRRLFGLFSEFPVARETRLEFFKGQFIEASSRRKFEKILLHFVGSLKSIRVYIYIKSACRACTKEKSTKFRVALKITAADLKLTIQYIYILKPHSVSRAIREVSLLADARNLSK